MVNDQRGMINRKWRESGNRPDLSLHLNETSKGAASAADVVMGNFWLKLKIWTKLVLVLLVVIYVVMFAAKNSTPTATIWLFFGDDPPRVVPVLQLVLIAFACGVVVTILA